MDFALPTNRWSDSAASTTSQYNAKKILHNTEIIASENWKSGLKLTKLTKGELKNPSQAIPIGIDKTTWEVVNIKNTQATPKKTTLYERIEYSQDKVDTQEFVDIEHWLGTKFMFVVVYSERNDNGDELIAHSLTNDKYLYKITDTTLSVSFAEEGTYDVLAFAA